MKHLKQCQYMLKNTINVTPTTTAITIIGGNDDD